MDLQKTRTKLQAAPGSSDKSVAKELRQVRVSYMGLFCDSGCDEWGEWGQLVRQSSVRASLALGEVWGL